MKSLWFALLFLAGGISHEIRNPLACTCLSVRRQSPRASTADEKT